MVAAAKSTTGASRSQNSEEGEYSSPIDQSLFFFPSLSSDTWPKMGAVTKVSTSGVTFWPPASWRQNQKGNCRELENTGEIVEREELFFNLRGNPIKLYINFWAHHRAVYTWI